MGTLNKIGNIYIIKNHINDKIYIGQTTSTIEKRFKRHLSDAKNPNRKGCLKLYNAINKFGGKNFYIEHLASAKGRENIDFLEIYFIKNYDSIKNGYNIKSGGHHDYKQVLTDEEKQRRSILFKERWRKVKEECRKLGIPNPQAGENAPMYGKKLTKEQRDKISKANKGMVSAMKGKVRSKEAIEKMKTHSRDEQRDQNIFYLIDSGNSVSKTSEILNIQKSTINYILNKRKNKSKGMVNTLYIIKNIENNKIYVGQIWGNFNYVRKRLKNGEFVQLINSIGNYDKNNFIIQDIASTKTQENADYLQSSFIKEFDSINNGYNV